MKLESKIFLLSVAVLGALASINLVLSAQEYSGMEMNLTISQPICIEISGNYSTGILFTNTTTIGEQYAITEMDKLNNATANYWGPSGGTEYWIRACSGNTINVTAYHCACDDLVCKSGSCAVGVDKLYVSYLSDAGGVGWANATTATGVPNSPPDTTNYYFPGPDSYQMVGGKLEPEGDEQYVYLRYWIDPRPDSAPSGVYNTTYKVRAVEITTDPGTCTC